MRRNIAAKVTHNYILRGLAQCGCCGSYLEDSAGTSKTGELYFYYRHRTADRKDGCVLPSLRAEGLEKMILSRLSYLSERQDIIQDIAIQANHNLEEEVPKIMSLLGERKKEYARLSREMDQCVQKVLELDSQTLKELIEPRVEELKKQREQVAGDISLLQKSLDELKGNVVSAIEIQEMLQSFQLLYKELPPHKQRELMSYIIKSVKVHPNQIEMALFGRANLERFQLAGGVFATNQSWLPD